MKRCYLLLLNLLLFPIFSAGADFHDYIPLGPSQVEVMLPTETRTVIDLSGKWQILSGGEELATTSVPGTLDIQPGVTLRRSVKIDRQTLHSRSWQIVFLGVSDEVEVRVNNRFIVRHPGGSAPFTADINERQLVAGSNTIELVLSNGGALRNLVKKFAPSGSKPWTGITREVFLVGTPQVWTSEVNTSVAFTSSYSNASVAAHATIRGASVDRLLSSSTSDEAMKQGSVNIDVEAVLRLASTHEIVARSATKSIRVERSRTVRTSLDMQVQNPRLWTPADPNLYEVEVRCSMNGALIDSYHSHIGLRSIRIAAKEDSRWLRLNDVPTFINAIDYIEEYPKVGTALSWRQMEHDVAMLKTLGVNTVRFVHSVPHPYMLYLCDRYGLMVMTEVNAAGIPSDILHEEEISAHLNNQADLLATYVGSHPSVIAVGLSDCLEEGSPITQAYHQRISKILRNRVSCPLYKVVVGGQVDAISEGGFDIVVLKMTTDRERKKMSDILSNAKRVVRSAAIITNIGSLLSPRNSNGFSDPLSLESQAVYIRDGWQATHTSGLAGCLVSSFSDYSLAMPTMLVDAENPYMQTSGLVDQWRQQRVAYDMYKSLINDEKEPLLQAREFTDGTPLVFVATGLVLALILTFLINRSRRFREYFIRSIVRPYNFYADIRDQRILSTIQTALLGLVIATGVGLVLAAMLYFLRTSSRMEYLLHLVIPFDTPYRLLRYVAWRPLGAVFFFSLLSFAVLTSSALVLRLGALFIKSKILYRDTLTIVVWSCVPLLALLPIGVALYQLMSADAMSFWVPLITVISIGWTLFRTLRATSVVFDVPGLYVYGIGLGTLALAVAILITIWAVNYDALEFFQYYRNVVSV